MSGGSFNPDEFDWETADERTQEILEEWEEKIDLQYGRYGNENFVVVGGSQIRVRPEIHAELDRDIEITRNEETLAMEAHPSLNSIADLVVSSDIWEDIDGNLKQYFTERSKAPYHSNHYYINIQKVDKSGMEKGYSGFLRVEENTGFDVIIETRDPYEQLDKDEFVAFPMADSTE